MSLLIVDDPQSMQNWKAANAELNDLMTAAGHKQATNKTMLAVNVLAIQKGKNNGLPEHFYHDHLPPRIAYTEEQRDLLVKNGFSTTYRHREYPKMLYRRNMNPRFEREDFVESRTINTKAEEEKLLAAKWVTNPAQLEPLPDFADETPDVIRARSEGEIDALRRQLAEMTLKLNGQEVAKRGPGRPAKQEE